MQTLPIIVDSQAPITINAQIAGQVKLLIALGKLQLGEALPTVVELAKELGVNHNTVAAVYNELTEFGYLVAQRGKGTFVAETQATQNLMIHQQCYELLSQAFLAALAVGLNPSEFATAAYAQGTFLSRHQATFLNLVFVAHSSADTQLYEDLQSEIGQPLMILHWDNLEASQPEALKKLRTADLVITTGKHLWEVTSVAAQEQEVIAVDVKPELKLLTQISSYPRHANLLLVGQDQAESVAMKQMLQEVGITHLNFHTLGLESFQRPKQLLERVDGVCASKGVFENIHQQLPQPEKVTVFEVSLEPTNLSVLKARLAAIQVAKLDKTEATGTAISI